MSTVVAVVPFKRCLLFQEIRDVPKQRKQSLPPCSLTSTENLGRRRVVVQTSGR
uniref:Uncharacterized protein n=1 Tax=Nelumbo nucifera TaxID=4432 RepID=A0A822Y3H3_NELNU|nr:TPA_asm: hypothetical protein HUJ06_028280 [Nelumbo nucifera]